MIRHGEYARARLVQVSVGRGALRDAGAPLYGGRGVARVRLGVPSMGAQRANALEDDGEPLTLEDGAIVVPYRPHELVTVKVA